MVQKGLLGNYGRLWQTSLYVLGALGVLIFITCLSYIQTDPERLIPRKVADKVHEVDYDPRTIVRLQNNRTDEEWIPVLREGKIIKIIRDEELRGLASKWKMVFEGGYVAMAKPVERLSPVLYEWEMIKKSQGYNREFYRRLRKSDRTMQGWTEIAAFYVDRVMGFYRKPPIVGRVLSSKLVFQNATDLFGKFYGSLPPFDVYVSLSAWMDGIHVTPPTQIARELLKMGYNHCGRPEDCIFAGDISDILVFDFIVDDHDRHLDHNWVSDSFRQLLFWDSGLSFNHGSHGKSSCLDLLCGPDKWKDAESKPCTRICRFRPSTIAKLQSMGPAVEKEKRLGARLREKIKDDNLWPLFHFNIYYLNQRFPKVRLEWEEFFDGLDVKVARLLEHVDQCIEQYGSDLVLDMFLER